MAREKQRPANQRSKSRPKRQTNSKVVKAPELNALKEMDKRLKKKKPTKRVEVDDTAKIKSKKREKSKTKKDVSGKKREKIQAKLEELADEVLDLEEDSEEKEELISSFEQDFSKLREMLSPENEMLRIDQASALFYRASLAMIMDLMPIAEDTYRKSKKESAAYALNALLNQARDLNSDVKMNEDVNGQVLIMNTLIHTNFTRIADLMLRERHSFSTKIDTLISKPAVRKSIKSELDSTIKSFIKGTNSLQKLLTMQIEAYLQGDPNYINPNHSNSESTNLKVSGSKNKRKRKT